MIPVTVHNLNLAVRDYTPDDRAFIAARWVRSYSAERADQPPHLYRPRWNRLVDVLLDRSLFSGRVSVACSPTTPEAILGFCVTEDDVLHYLYVQPQLFRGGLGKALLTYNLGSYPKRVIATHHWPWRSDRFVFDFFPLIQGT